MLFDARCLVSSKIHLTFSFFGLELNQQYMLSLCTAVLGSRDYWSSHQQMAQHVFISSVKIRLLLLNPRIVTWTGLARESFAPWAQHSLPMLGCLRTCMHSNRGNLDDHRISTKFSMTFRYSHILRIYKRFFLITSLARLQPIGLLPTQDIHSRVRSFVERAWMHGAIFLVLQARSAVTTFALALC